MADPASGPAQSPVVTPPLNRRQPLVHVAQVEPIRVETRPHPSAHLFELFVSRIEENLEQLYDDQFIETCDDWVVPYIGDLIGWQQVHEAGEPSDAASLRGQQRNKILIPRRELANTIRYRRRKGTLSLLELLAFDVAGWHARAVEFFRLLGSTQNINLSHIHRGGTVDVRQDRVLHFHCFDHR